MNKKGNMLPRDAIIMILIFSGIIALSNVFVTQMATEYGNENMTSSYDSSSIGTNMLEENAETWEGIGEDLSGDNGVIKMLTGSLEAAGQIFKEVLKAPATFGNMVGSLFESLGVEEVEGETDLVDIITFIITALLYAIIVFGIIQALLRGGKV